MYNNLINKLKNNNNYYIELRSCFFNIINKKNNSVEYTVFDDGYFFDFNKNKGYNDLSLLNYNTFNN